MPYLIDSDWVIDHLDNVPQAVQLLDRLASDGIAISTITYMEVMQGRLRSPDPEEAESKFAEFLRGVPVVPLSLGAARRCAIIRETLRREGRRVNARALDLIIAATAIEHNLILVTRNTHDYADIPDLKLYEEARP